jgi:hypothetical protein
MTLSAGAITKTERLYGANIVGIAPVNRIEKAPKGFHPQDILAVVRSIIFIGKYFPIGRFKRVSKAAMKSFYV